jgi:disulfide bond formation protein DsbB
MPTHFNPNRFLVPAFTPLFAIGVSTLALAVAYLAQYAGGLYPCTLCYWQRIPYAIILLTGLAAFLARKKYQAFSQLLNWLCLMILLAAAGLGILHAGVEYGWWEGPGMCSAPIETNATPEEILARIMNAPAVSCKVVAVRIIGLSMAGWNAIYALAAAWALFIFIRKT